MPSFHMLSGVRLHPIVKRNRVSMVSSLTIPSEFSLVNGWYPLMRRRQKTPRSPHCSLLDRTSARTACIRAVSCIDRLVWHAQYSFLSPRRLSLPMEFLRVFVLLGVIIATHKIFCQVLDTLYSVTEYHDLSSLIDPVRRITNQWVHLPGGIWHCNIYSICASANGYTLWQPYSDSGFVPIFPSTLEGASLSWISTRAVTGRGTGGPKSVSGWARLLSFSPGPSPNFQFKTLYRAI